MRSGPHVPVHLTLFLESVVPVPVTFGFELQQIPFKSFPMPGKLFLVVLGLIFLYSKYFMVFFCQPNIFA